MKHIYAYIYSLLSLVMCGQNLVPNGSFENYTDCPTAASFYKLIPWCGLAGGEDSFDTCFTTLYGSGGIGVPYNLSDGFQYPKTGHGMGCVLLHVPGMGQENKREYLHVPLINTLQPGKVYCGTFYVNLSNEFKYTTDKIGMALTSNSYVCNQAMPMPQTIAPLNIIPQVANPTGNFITDTLNWIEVSSTFTVTGNEAYLTIGNFYDDANTNVTLFNPSATRTIIYLFIDDVSVEEVQVAKAKNDTLIYAGDSTVIGNNPSEAAIYNWQPATGLNCNTCSNPKASPNVTTTYTLTKTQCKSVTTDMITVSVSPTNVKNIAYTSEAFSVIPNPTNEIISIISRFDFEKIELTSITGQVLISETINNKYHQLQLQNFAEGIYFVKVVYTNGMSVTKKVIKN